MIADLMTMCAHCGSEPRHGRSKYCRPCAKVARLEWLKMVKEKCAERDDRYGQFSDLVVRARRAGEAAAVAVVPTPIAVCAEDGSLVQVSRAGDCGYACVRIRPATCSFAQWLVRERLADVDRYAGGVSMSMAGHVTSIEIREAYAKAFCAVLVEAGIGATWHSRLD